MRWFARGLGFLGCGVAIGILLGAASAYAGSPPSDATYVGNDACAMCHDDVVAEYPSTLHGQVYWSGTSGHHVDCESCHGPGSAHAEEGDAALINNPGRTDEAGNSSNCLTCHTDFEQAQVFGDAHYAISGGCADCHTEHGSATGLKQAGSVLCFDCHQDKMAQASMPSHHPVREGLMECTDCHDPHGRSPLHLAEGGGGNELCFSCHAAKEGPFIFEHAPVVEDCGICHDPHGTVADNLLVQPEPALCLSCHQMHFHTEIAGMVGEFTVPVYPERGGESSLQGFKEAMLTKCTQCHVAIHGTDEPAQSITAPGALSR